LVSVVHIPLKVTLPRVISGLSWNANQLITRLLFVGLAAREQSSNPALFILVANQAEGE